MQKVLVLSLMVFVNLSLVKGQSDSLIVTYKEYLENILKYHPLAKKADLRNRLADAEMLGARGNLDPLIDSDWNQKSFDDKLYYRQYQAKFTIPTTLGVAFTGGYENTEGLFLNPEDNTDEFGLWHVGIEADILQGLLVNERRTALDQARVFQDMAENQQRNMINDLIFEASEAYLYWQKNQFFRDVLLENVELSVEYFAGTRQSYLNGEKTALDTLEAFILVQDALTQLQKNDLDLIKSRQNVENFLWFNEVPLVLQDSTVAEDYDNDMLQIPSPLENTNIAMHPIIQESMNKLSMIEIEQRLKREKLKPKLKLKFNPLLATTENDATPTYSINDYKWGLDFAMPLFFRSARADVQRGEVKILETKLDLDNKRNELQNKIENSWQQQLLYQDQIALMERNVDSYRRLLEGERIKFAYGESSVFIVNKRQEKYIDGQLKLIETNIKRQLQILKYLYFSNQLIL